MPLRLLPLDDSPALADRARSLLDIPRAVAAARAAQTLADAEMGSYDGPNGARVDWAAAVRTAVGAKQSIPGHAALASLLPRLPGFDLTLPRAHAVTAVSVANRTTLEVARSRVDAGARVAVLNFANGLHPGGGFLSGARAQEESICRVSALYVTLRGDPMYAHHASLPHTASSDWVIHSPGVPVHRDEDGAPLPAPWRVGVLTCAAPVVRPGGLSASGGARLLEPRIRRVRDLAWGFGYDTLVLGAWGCGAFGNDPHAVARLFRESIEEAVGAFAEVCFAVADWSAERRFIGPFAQALAAPG